jgi:hypothetical protein
MEAALGTGDPAPGVGGGTYLLVVCRRRDAEDDEDLGERWGAPESLCPSPCWCPSRERKQEYGECYQKRSECRA